MKTHRSIIPLAALAIAVSAALPASADTRVSVENGRHHYVYYSDKDIYYSPERKVYYWVEDGHWRSGPNLPSDDEDYVVRAKGVDIDLDTDKPYERNDYVVKNYGPDRETTTTRRTTSDDGMTTTTTTTTRHRYVFYGDRDIYFAPERHVYYWRDNGRWLSGTNLPPAFEPYVRGGGVTIELDTDRPYERNAYVIAHYGHRHDRDDDD
jgi:hypothetical protein